MSNNQGHDSDFWDDVATVQSTARAKVLSHIKDRPLTPTQIVEQEEKHNNYSPNLVTITAAIRDMNNDGDDEDVYTNGKLVERVTSKRRRDNMYRATEYGEDVYDNLLD